MNRRLTWLLGSAIGIVLLGGIAAWAFFTSTANASQVVSASALAAPTAPTATAAGTTAINVGWTSPGSQPAGTQYQVTRTSPTPSTVVCTTSTSSCQDTGLTPGTSYSYSIAAVLDSWQSSAISASASTTQAAPTIATTPSPSTGNAGGSFSDSAMLTGSYQTAGETISFSLYNTSTCSTGLVGTVAGTLVSGTATSSTGVTVNAAGSYYWQASYPGDAHNSSVTSSCGEKTVVTTPSSSPTLASSGPPVGIANTAIPASSISAVLTGSSAATGTITFTVFGPQNTAPTTCTSGGTVVGTATVSGNGSYSPSAGFTPSPTGTYWWYASYNGDTNNNPAGSGCGAAMTDTIGPAISGSPFGTGGAPGLESATYSPSGGLLATANEGNSTVSTFTVNSATGALTAAGSVSTGADSDPFSVAFSPGGGLLATASEGNSTVSTFKVNSATGALTAAGSVSTGANSYPFSVAFSPGGGLLATANGNSTVSMFTVNSATGALTAAGSVSTGASSYPYSVAFSPGGGLLATANGNSTVSMFTVNSATGALTAAGSVSTGASSYPYSVAFSPGGGLLATANEGNSTASTFTVNSATGALTPAGSVSTGASSNPYSVAFSPGGGLLAIANIGNSTASTFTVNSATGALTAAGSVSTGLSNPSAVSFNPVSGQLAVGNFGNNAVAVFRVAYGSTVVTAAPTLTTSERPTTNPGVLVASNQISATMAGFSGSNAGATVTFKVFGPQAAAPTTCEIGGTVVGTAAVSGNGTYHPTAGYTPATPGEYWWYASFGGDANNSSANSGCGTAMTATVGTQVSGSPVALGGLHSQGLAYSPNGQLLASANVDSSDVSVFNVDPATGALTAVIGSPFSTGGGSAPHYLAFSPNGKLLAAADYGTGTVSVFTVDSTTGVLTAVGIPIAVGINPDGVGFSPGGGLLAVANFGSSSLSMFTIGSTGALSRVSGSPYTTGSNPAGVAFSPTGAFVATANDVNSGNVSVFAVNASTGALTQVVGSPFATATNAGPQSLAYSPNGGLLAVGLSGTNSVAMYTVNASSGVLSQVTGSPFALGGVWPFAVRFSPGGGFLAAANYASSNVSLFTVNSSTGALSTASTTATGSGPQSLAWSPDGQWLADGNANGAANTLTVLPVTFPSTVVTFAPVVSVSAPATALSGSVISASQISAALSGAAGSGVTAKITIKVFGPQAAAPTYCDAGGTVVGTVGVSGNGTYHPSAGYTPTATGTYWWTASYTGDANDSPETSGCSTVSTTVS